MSYVHPNKLEAAIFDWAGTIVDFGSFAPTKVFVEAFAEFGINISLEQARGPMGIAKWDHIRSLCNENAVIEQFQRLYGRIPTDEDVTSIYNRFMPLQLEKIGQYSDLIPGCLQTVQFLRDNNIKIGSCSGYPKKVLNKVTEISAERGLVVDHSVAGDEVPKGRPLPSQALANVVALSIENVGACVKVDDTVPGILEGRRSGMWTVALTCSGNSMGLTLSDYNNLSSDEKDRKSEEIGELFREAKPHYLIKTIAELPAVILDINKRLSVGESAQAQ